MTFDFWNKTNGKQPNWSASFDSNLDIKVKHAITRNDRPTRRDGYEKRVLIKIQQSAKTLITVIKVVNYFLCFV